MNYTSHTADSFIQKKEICRACREKREKKRITTVHIHEFQLQTQHSVAQHQHACIVHMSIRNSILTRDAAVPRCLRRLQRDMWPCMLIVCLQFSYETCVLTCRINFYCTFSLRRLGLMRLSASLLSSDLATQHNTAMQAESACMRE